MSKIHLKEFSVAANHSLKAFENLLKPLKNGFSDLTPKKWEELRLRSYYDIKYYAYAIEYNEYYTPTNVLIQVLYSLNIFHVATINYAATNGIEAAKELMQEIETRGQFIPSCDEVYEDGGINEYIAEFEKTCLRFINELDLEKDNISIFEISMFFKTLRMEILKHKKGNTTLSCKPYNYISADFARRINFSEKYGVRKSLSITKLLPKFKLLISNIKWTPRLWNDYVIDIGNLAYVLLYAYVTKSIEMTISMPKIDINTIQNKVTKLLRFNLSENNKEDIVLIIESIINTIESNNK